MERNFNDNRYVIIKKEDSCISECRIFNCLSDLQGKQILPFPVSIVNEGYSMSGRYPHEICFNSGVSSEFKNYLINCFERGETFVSLYVGNEKYHLIKRDPDYEMLITYDDFAIAYLFAKNDPGSEGICRIIL